MPPAADRWAEALAAWAIPDHILAAAPASPWDFPVPLFADAAARAAAGEGGGPSRARAIEAVPRGGSVLDVGVGAGAASLPLAPPAALLVGVDQSRAMLDAFAEAAARRGVAHRRLCLGADRDGEIDALLPDEAEQPSRRVVTLWWDGRA